MPAHSCQQRCLLDPQPKEPVGWLCKINLNNTASCRRYLSSPLWAQLLPVPSSHRHATCNLITQRAADSLTLSHCSLSCKGRDACRPHLRELHRIEVHGPAGVSWCQCTQHWIVGVPRDYGAIFEAEQAACGWAFDAVVLQAAWAVRCVALGIHWGCRTGRGCQV
jgi:hypothetical protein